MTQEQIRLSESSAQKKHWKRWGPYPSERAWGTVREDYSPHGIAWEYFLKITPAHAPIAGTTMANDERIHWIRQERWIQYPRARAAWTA
jgi:hypothetical protein